MHEYVHVYFTHATALILTEGFANMQVLLFALVALMAKEIVPYILIGYSVKDLNQILPAAYIQVQKMEPIISLMWESSANQVRKEWLSYLYILV